MNTKQLFLANKELSGRWNSIVQSPFFEQVVIHAKSMFFEEGRATEQVLGAMRILDILRTLPENEPNFAQVPGPGLVHNLAAELERLAQQPREK
jgi:hypothetical protein